METQFHTFQTFFWSRNFCPYLLTSRDYYWHWYLTWWFPANEILNIKPRLQIALPSKVIHNFCQGSKEGTLEQPEKKRKQNKKKPKMHRLLLAVCVGLAFLSLLPNGLVKCILSDKLIKLRTPLVIKQHLLLPYIVHQYNFSEPMFLKSLAQCMWLVFLPLLFPLQISAQNTTFFF